MLLPKSTPLHPTSIYLSKKRSENFKWMKRILIMGIMHFLHHIALLLSVLWEILEWMYPLSCVLFPLFALFIKTDRVEDRESWPCGLHIVLPMTGQCRAEGNNHPLVVLHLFHRGHLARRIELEGWRSAQALCSVMRWITVHALQICVCAWPWFICLWVLLWFV